MSIDAAAVTDQTWKDIAIDHDGVMNLYDGWHGQHEDWPVRPGARAFLAALKADGWNIIVLTARSGEFLAELEDWYIAHGLREYVSHFTNVKPPCKIYLDDCGLQFTGDFNQALDAIRHYRCHWEAD